MTELVLKCHQFEKKVALTLGLSVDEMHCLSQLYLHTPFCIKKLTELLGVSATRMSRLLLVLEKKGLITRRQSPLDRRIEQVSLTNGGTAIVTKLLEMSEEAKREIFSDLPPEEYSPSPRGPDGEFTDE